MAKIVEAVTNTRFRLRGGCPTCLSGCPTGREGRDLRLGKRLKHQTIPKVQVQRTKHFKRSQSSDAHDQETSGGGGRVVDGR